MYDYMQFIEASGMMPLPFPDSYNTISACYAWTNLDFGFTGKDSNPNSEHPGSIKQKRDSLTFPVDTLLDSLIESYSLDEFFSNNEEEAEESRYASRKLMDFQSITDRLNIPFTRYFLLKIGFYFLIIAIPLILAIIFMLIGLCLRPNLKRDIFQLHETAKQRKRRSLFLAIQWWCFGLVYRISYFTYFSICLAVFFQFRASSLLPSSEKNSLFSFGTALAAIFLVCFSFFFFLFFS